ncbi:MAG: hypothetical protein VKO00_04875 [Cyanobacteriota bacterium]|jgi:hypothetical protein|nr:hypothetical protein [Cyanobacteriota bacterium]
MSHLRAGSGFEAASGSGAGGAVPNFLAGMAGLGMAAGEEGAEAQDPVEAYFECITTCSLDDGECITTCAEVLRGGD